MNHINFEIQRFRNMMIGISLSTVQGGAGASDAHPGNNLLLEDGSNFLLETGDALLFE